MSPRPRRKRDCINCKAMKQSDPESGFCYLGCPIIKRRMGPQGLALVWVPCKPCPKPKTWAKLIEADRERKQHDTT